MILWYNMSCLYKDGCVRKMKEIKIHTDYITLGQLLKLANAVDSGIVAKLVIQDGQVKVNGDIELRRGRKLYKGDIVSFDAEDYMIQNED